MIIHKAIQFATILLTVFIGGCFSDNSDNNGSIVGENSENDPWVQINYPAQWGTVSGVGEVRVEAGPVDEIDHVTLFVDGLVQSVDSVPPYFFIWDVDGLSGTHTIFARAFTSVDSVDSGLLTVSVSETPIPSPVITSPPNLSTVNGSITILAEETRSVDVDTLVLYIDGLRYGADDSAPYQFIWTVPEGVEPHTLFVRSWARNQSAISPLVTVFTEANGDSEFPFVQITSPPDWAQVQGVIQVIVEAHDNVGIDMVTLMLDGFEHSTLSLAPYRFQLDTDLLTVGNHTLISKAFDVSGNFNISNMVTLVIE